MTSGNGLKHLLISIQIFVKNFLKKGLYIHRSDKFCDVVMLSSSDGVMVIAVGTTAEESHSRIAHLL